MPAKPYAQDKPNPLAPRSALAEETRRMYGEGVEPIPVLSIRPDLRQPRRVIPASVRGAWDGDPQDLPEVLARWRDAVERRLGQGIDLPALLKATGDGEPDLSGDPLVDAYAKLVSLAASIYKDGLEQPVAVTRDGAGYKIIWGERRWAAYMLLMLHVAGTYDAIPALVKPKADVWAQAAENGARAPLNAIGMARQLALLVMDMYPDAWRNGDFQDYDALLLPGECDRKYYAQVANGNVYRIPKGLGQRVLDVTGLPSMERVRNYRALLSIPDELWIRADEQGMSESAIRDYLEATKQAQSEAVTSLRDTVGQPTVSITPDSGTLTPAEGETALKLTETQINVLMISYEERDNDHEGWYPMGAPGTPGEMAQTPLIARGYLEVSEVPRPIDKKLVKQIRITQAGIAAYLAVRPVADDPLTAYQGEEDEQLAGLVEGDAAEAAFKLGDLALTPGGVVVEVVAADEATINTLSVNRLPLTFFAGEVTRIDVATRDALTPSQRNDVAYFTSRARTSETDAAVAGSPAAPAPTPEWMLRYPLGSCVWHLTTGKVGRVISHDREHGELVISEVGKPDTQMARFWLPSMVRPATEAEVAAGGWAGRRDTAASPRSGARHDEDRDDGTRQTAAETLDHDGEARGAARETLAAETGGETTTPLLEAWDNPRLAPVLKHLVTLVDGADEAGLRQRLLELQTVSRAEVWRASLPDIQGIHPALSSPFQTYVRETEGLLRALVEARITAAVAAYCDHLCAVGRALEAQRRDED